MGVNQMASGAIMLIGVAICAASCMQTWRQGIGSRSLQQFPGMLGPGFEKREYTLFKVVGNKERSWSDLMHLTCGRAARVAVAAGAVEEGGCEGENADRMAEECSEHFLETLEKRCSSYNNIFSASKGLVYGTVGCCALALIGAISMLAPKGPLKKFRPMVLPIGVGCYVGCVIAAGAWAYITDMEFWALGKDTMYPYPSLTTGFFTYVMGMHGYLVGGLAGFSDFNGTAEEEEDGKGEALLSDAGTEESNTI